MKKVFIMFLATAVVASSTTSCKKGENDPFLSLKSRKGRMAGEWVLTTQEKTVTDIDSDGDGTRTEYSLANGVRTVVNHVLDNNSSIASSTNEYDYSTTVTMEKDGSMTLTEVSTQTKSGGTTIPASAQVTTTINVTGNWTFLGKNKDLELKNKEGFTMTFKTVNETYSGAVTGTDNTTFTGLNEGAINLIDQLKNKEMISTVDWMVTDDDGDKTTVTETSTFEKQ